MLPAHISSLAERLLMSSCNAKCCALQDAWFQGNAFSQIFPSAGRVFAGHEMIPSLRAGTDYLLRKFERQINESMLLGNFWVREFGGGVETLGGLAYVTEALLQSHEGFLRLFPGLPPGEGASFTGLRARGALVVNATIADGHVTDFRVRSEAGRNVTVLSTSGLRVASVRSGTAVAVRRVLPAAHLDQSLDGQLWMFATARGGEYELTMTP